MRYLNNQNFFFSNFMAKKQKKNHIIDTLGYYTDLKILIVNKEITLRYFDCFSALSNYHEGVILMTTTFTAIELNLDLIILEIKPKFLILSVKLSLRKGV